MNTIDFENEKKRNLQRVKFVDFCSIVDIEIFKQNRIFPF